MEERERIPRREAVIGLSLLGLMLVAMTGTIVFQIVHAAPQRAPTAQTATDWVVAPSEPAASNPATLESPAPPSDDRYAAAPETSGFSPAAQIPTIGDGSSSVPATSMAPAPGPAQMPTPSIADPRPVEPARPRFVAPSGH